jgi:hypothetical protein
MEVLSRGRVLCTMFLIQVRSGHGAHEKLTHYYYYYYYLLLLLLVIDVIGILYVEKMW